MSTELFCLLVDKTSGEAANKVSSSHAESGFEAYQAVHRWFKQTSTLAVTERVKVLMHPAAAKSESEVLIKLEQWRRDMKDLERE